MNIIEESAFRFKVLLCVVAVAIADSVHDVTKITKYNSIPSNIPRGYPPLVYTFSIHPTITTYSNGQVETVYGDVSHRTFSDNQGCTGCQNNVPEVRIGAHTKYSRLKGGKSLELPSQKTNYIPVTKGEPISFSNAPDSLVKSEDISSRPFYNVYSTTKVTSSSDASRDATTDFYKSIDQTSFSSSVNNEQTNPSIDSRFSGNLRNTPETRSRHPVSKFTITYVPVPSVSGQSKYDKSVLNNEQYSNKDSLGSSKPAYYYNVESVKSDGSYYSGPQVFSNPNFLTNTAIPFFQNSYVTPTTDPASSKNAYTQSTTSIYPSIENFDSSAYMQVLPKGQILQMSTPVSDSTAESSRYISSSQSAPTYSSAPDVSSASYNSQQVSYNW